MQAEMSLEDISSCFHIIIYNSGTLWVQHACSSQCKQAQMSLEDTSSRLEFSNHYTGDLRVKQCVQLMALTACLKLL